GIAPSGNGTKRQTFADWYIEWLDAALRRCRLRALAASLAKPGPAKRGRRHRLRSARLRGGESLDDIERLVDMLAEADLRIEAVAAHAGFVEHEGDAAGEAEPALDAPVFCDGAARIAKQRERQAMVRFERRVRGGVVARHADHLGSGGDEVFV